MNLVPMELVREDLKTVEARMREFPVPPAQMILEALDHLLSAGGKRLRPALSLLFGRMLRVPDGPLIDFSASLEMIHTATLVHDDLVDDSPVRRGVPTANSRLSAGTAILVGDFLFACAAQLAAAAGSIPVMKRFASTLSIIVDGEVRQITKADSTCTLAEYERQIQSKTAALFEVSCEGPALLVEDLPAAYRAAEFGRAFGMAFQIADDLMDFSGDSVGAGKPVGHDLRQGLLTLPAIFFFHDHPQDPDVAAFLTGKREPERLDRMVEKIGASEAVERSRQRARDHIRRAVASLASFPAGSHRSALEALALSIV
jgi:geranylgeranyl pyrophosphate synthase